MFPPFENDDELIARLNKPIYAPRPRPTPIPAARWDDCPAYCLQVNDEWLGHILGALDVLDQADTWKGTNTEIEGARNQVREMLAAFMGDESMKCCCDQTPQIVLHRVSPDGIILEVSYDDGITWVQDPEDPRLAVTQLPPPVPGSSANKCDAASNGLEHLKDIQAGISQSITVTATLFDITLAVLALIFSIVAAGVAPPLLIALVPVIIGIVTSIVNQGQGAYDALFTNQVWDEMLCILYCHISDDGTFTQARYDQVVADCLTKISGGASIFSAATSLQSMITTMGLYGLNNICAYGNAANSDCTSCDCDCKADWDFTVQSYANVLKFHRGTWEVAKGWKATVQTPTGGGLYYATITIPVNCPPSYFRFWLHTPGSAATHHQGYGFKYVNNDTGIETVVPVSNVLNCGSATECGGASYLIGSGNITITELTFQCDSATSGTAWLEKIRHNTVDVFP